MQSLSDDVIRLIMSFLIPKQHCLLKGPPTFMAYFCADNYTNKIKLEKEWIKVKKEWNKCTNDKALDSQICRQHTENYTDLLKADQVLHRYCQDSSADFIHFNTKQQAKIGKSYLKKNGYIILQDSCCFGKGFLPTKINKMVTGTKFKIT